MTDPVILQSLIGQQYIVIRPTDPIAIFYDKVQSSLREKLPSVVTYPNVGHITLRGFSQPEKIDQIRTSLTKWASQIKPMEISIENFDSFPPPFKVLILKVQSTNELKSAYTELTQVIEADGLHTIGVQRNTDEWIFHMSLAYCEQLSDTEFVEAINILKAIQLEKPSTIANELEFVDFDENGEHGEIIALT
jgi:2'-5' RNA ligase